MPQRDSQGSFSGIGHAAHDRIIEKRRSPERRFIYVRNLIYRITESGMAALTFKVFSVLTFADMQYGKQSGYLDRTTAFITSLYATKSTPATGHTIQVISQRMVTKLHPRYIAVVMAQ